MSSSGSSVQHGASRREPDEAGLRLEAVPHPQRLPKVNLEFWFWDFEFWILDLKQYLIINDFPSVNEAISQNSNMFKEMQVFDLIQSLH